MWGATPDRREVLNQRSGSFCMLVWKVERTRYRHKGTTTEGMNVLETLPLRTFRCTQNNFRTSSVLQFLVGARRHSCPMLRKQPIGAAGS